jgi:type IV secretion system protein VirD4
MEQFICMTDGFTKNRVFPEPLPPMTEDEIAVMDGGKCILQIRGARPFFSDKYDITKHKNYRLLADENEKNRYKVEKELNPQYTPKPEEEVEVIHVELSE